MGEMKEVTLGAEMHQFEIGKPIEGELKEVKRDVGANNSNVYVVGDKTFWGTSELDLLLVNVKTGKKVSIELLDSDYKFPSGRRGKHFRVLAEE